jgi:uncharacterized protein (TIGR02996 family)
MEHEEAFLRDISEHPDDDTPRLIYADWLEEHGDADRAAFIRTQCELARLPEDDPHADDLAFAEDALLNAHEERWAGLPGRVCPAVVFRRGFVDEVSLDTGTFLRHADELFRAAPLRCVRLIRGLPLDLPAPQLAACPHLARLRELDVEAPIREDGVAVLAASPHLRSLDTLILQGCYTLGPAGTRALAEAPHLSGLRCLDLSCYSYNSSNRCGAEGVRVLAAASRFAGLTALWLESTNPGLAGVRALAASPHLTGLGTLVLSRNRLGVGSVRALARSPNCRSLRLLDLDDNDTAHDSAEALARSPHLTGLRALALQCHGAAKEVIGALADLPALTALTLGDGRAGDDAVATLASSALLGRLTFLSLYARQMTAAGVRALAHCPRLAGLRALRLWLGPDAAGALPDLLASPYLAALRRLSLHWSEVRDEDLERLAEAPRLAQLTTLRLQANCDLSHFGLCRLAASPHLGRLRELALFGIQPHAAGKQEAARAFLRPASLGRLRILRLGVHFLDEPEQRLLRERWGKKLVSGTLFRIHPHDRLDSRPSGKSDTRRGELPG